MGLVPRDFPHLLAARGLQVYAFDDWERAGRAADHGAIALHHTASSRTSKPEADAAYCHHGAKDAPLYNVLVDRVGKVWLLARHKSNNAGRINGASLNEALHGAATSVSAVKLGRGDTTSANDRLFAVAAQNDGSGEPWQDAMVHAISVVSAVACETLGLTPGHVTQHRVLTARKVDNCGDACPYDWQPLIAAEMGARPKPPAEETEMWVIEAEVPVGTREAPGELVIGLPFGRKSARVDLWLECDHDDGAQLWGAQKYEGGTEAIGLWNNGHQWELWLPGRQRSFTGAVVDQNSSAVHLQNQGPKGPVHVTLSGT